MKSLFRSRLAPPLTSAQINHLTKQSRLPSEDIEEWYGRFHHCYPRGYLSFNEFVTYVRQLRVHNGATDDRSTKSLVKQLFRLLDLNEDKHLEFEDFLLFNILIRRGSIENKLTLIFNLYDRQKDKYLSRQQLENVLSNMFDLLSVPKPKDGLSQRIDTILTRMNSKNVNSKISWHAFSTSLLDDSSLLELLVSDPDTFEDDAEYLITRF